MRDFLSDDLQLPAKLLLQFRWKDPGGLLFISAISVLSVLSSSFKEFISLDTVGSSKSQSLTGIDERLRLLYCGRVNLTELISTVTGFIK